MGGSGRVDRRAFLRKASKTGAVAGLAAGFVGMRPGAAEAEDSRSDLVAHLDVDNTFSADNYFRSGRPWADVRGFGAKGDGVTNEASAVAAAVAALSDLGGTVYFPPGKYLLGSTVLVTKPNVEFVGSGNVGESPGLGDPGATQLLVADGIPGIQIGDGSTNMRRGPILRNLCFRARSNPAGPNTIGLRVMGASNGRLHNCSFVGFNGAGGIGMWQKGSAGNPNYLWAYYDCNVADCLTGYRLEECTGHNFYNGYVKGNDIGTSRPPGSTGLLTTGSGGGTHRINGTNFQYWQVAVLLEAAEGSQIFGGRFEANDTSVKIASPRCGLWGSSFTNYQIGSGGTAVEVTPSSTCTTLIPGSISSVGTRVRDNGVQTAIFDNAPPDGRILRLPTVGGTAKIEFGDDVNVYRPAVANRLKTDDLFQAADGLATKTVSGTISDGSFTSPPPDGTMAIDAVNRRLYVRIGGRWRYVRLSG